MSLSEPWTNSTPASVTKKNKTSVITVSGNDAASLDKTKFKLVALNADGTAGDKDDLLMVNATEDSFINLRDTAEHAHTNSSTGGTVFDIFAWNNTFFVLQLTKTDDLKKAQWIETVTSSGTIEDATDGTTGERSIRLRPNGTSGSGSTISYPHLKLDFSKPFLFQTKLRIETATNLAIHSGVGADDVTAADSNTRKLQAEVCTTTNNNYWLRTANGSANSASDSGIAITTNRTKVDVEHDPTAGTPSAYLYVAGGTVLTKTTNIPTSGATVENNLIKHSIKNSTAADRPMHTYGSRLIYYISDTWGH